MLNNKSVLITGGTGSLGQALVAEILRRWPDIGRLVVLSRDELKQYQMAQDFPPEDHPALRFFLGDVRDVKRLRRAFNRVDVVIHAAALKQVPAAEYNPMEFIHTNVIGAENVIEAAIDAGVKTIVALSTDKAAAPINLYGATKLCSDKLFIAANAYGAPHLRSSVVRYGNVMASRGSVIPYFLDKAPTGSLPITDPAMTRFNISLDQGVELVLTAVKYAIGGEIFVPKISSYRLMDVAQAIGPNCRHEIIGIRPGEKIHEEMITTNDSHTTVDVGEYYVILPVCDENNLQEYKLDSVSKKVDPGFSYNSRDNPKFLTIEDIQALIRKHVDPNFQPV
jgi:UDP-N-acetylglucosamine 4,6-dehydratase (inverting)